MVKTKKSRGRKKFQYHVNRKKENKKFKKLPNINCPSVKKEWKDKISPQGNLKIMGLVHNPNKNLPIRPEPVNPGQEPSTSTKEVKKTAVVQQLEKEANAPRNGTMRIPGQKVQWIEYLLDKYGEDYEAMTRDKNNHYQETAAQLRQKIQQYKKRPAYLIPFLRKRGMLETSKGDTNEEKSEEDEDCDKGVDDNC